MLTQADVALAVLIKASKQQRAIDIPSCGSIQIWLLIDTLNCLKESNDKK